jgi:hypothetical protein
MKVSKAAFGISLLVLATCANFAHAQFKLPGGLGGLSSGGGDASVTSDALVASFIKSNTEILTAQKFLALAYDQKDKAALLESEAQALQSDGVGADELKKAVELSQKTNEELAAKQAEKTQLSEQEKQYYVQSLPHFARGVVGTRKLVGEVASFRPSAKHSMMGGGLAMLKGGMGKAKEAMFVAKATPGYSKSVFDTFRKTVMIGKSNKVKMPADATSALAGLDP